MLSLRLVAALVVLRATFAAISLPVSAQQHAALHELTSQIAEDQGRQTGKMNTYLNEFYGVARP